MFTALLHCIFCTIKKLQFLLRYLSGVFSLFLPGSGYETYNSVSGSRKKFRIQPNPDSQWENETSSNFFFFLSTRTFFNATLFILDLCSFLCWAYFIVDSVAGGIPAGIDPSLLTSAAFELVQASQALQAVQAVPPLLHGESPPIMTPLTQVGICILYSIWRSRI